MTNLEIAIALVGVANLFVASKRQPGFGRSLFCAGMCASVVMRAVILGMLANG